MGEEPLHTDSRGAQLPGDLTSTRAHRVHVRLESGLDYDYERERDR